MNKAILFDLDGVLVDACDWHYEALNLALMHFQKDPIPRDLHLTLYNGLPTHVKLEMMGISETEAKEINRLKQVYTLTTIRSKATNVPEKVTLHTYLKSHDYKIACVTNSIKETATEMLKATGQFDFMDLLITNEDVKNNKPSPDCYNLAIKKLNADPTKTIIVEDSVKGMQAAKASNATTCIRVKDPSQVTIDIISPYLE
jgi:HAD superfamily hydrolase (TIGR01509 family)